MSLIIGYVTDNKVYMATESQRRIGNYSYGDATDTGSNVFYLPHGILCGIEGIELRQLIRSNPKLFEKFATEQFTLENVVRYVLGDLYDLVDDAGLITKKSKERGDAAMSGTIMLAKDDKLICIDDDFAIVEIAQFCIIGSAAQQAYARMISNDFATPCQEILYLALCDGKKFSRNVKEPFYLYCTDSEERIELKGE